MPGDDEQAGVPGEVGDQVFGQPVREGTLLGIVADAHEGQHGNRRLVGQWQGFSLGVTELFDSARETVADARNRGDPFAAVARTKQLPELRDLDGEVAFLDGRTRPCRIHQLCLGEDFAGPSDKRREQFSPRWLTATGTLSRSSVPAPGSSTNGPKAKRDPCMRRIYSPFGSFWNFSGELNYPAVRIRQKPHSGRGSSTLKPYGGCHERCSHPCAGGHVASAS